MNAATALRSAAGELAAAGCETPRLDAELMLADSLGVARGRLHSEPELELDRDARAGFADALRRRAAEREPVAYIVSRRGFRELELAVDPRALIPRPETEHLVESALGLPPGWRVLDVGTGCGAVALALASERPHLEVHGSDISARALELAGENSRRLGIAVRWLAADLLDGLEGPYQAIVANLPYIAEGERASLAPEILRHEPHDALFAGLDGLSAIRRLAAQLAVRRDVRFAALEVGAGQAPAVAGLLRESGFPSVRSERDLAGVERVVVGERGGAMTAGAAA
ncbi:MAG TPA: peptide chain release factor N(5)-glutamine methyltransferase [Solirubrobacteraceae bacterium]|nr:peptide chain release factor N(5)-glutamine methyltransferase [Solirubrobacteraceae bacterium]